MPKREIGLMGYVGEAVVRQWLVRKYPPDQFEIVDQIMPEGVPKQGGPYLDFGVIRDGRVEAVFEVKSQDYIWNSAVNLSLSYLWSHRTTACDFVIQGGRAVAGLPTTEAYLVLLVAPNDKGIDHIDVENIRNVVLFADIWNDLAEEFDQRWISDQFEQDLPKVLSVLRAPRSGKQVTRDFLKLRGMLRALPC